jgi:hypothetical protein
VTRRLAILVAAAGILTACATAQLEEPRLPAAKAVQIGEKTVRLPPPAGWVEADAGNDMLHAQLARMISNGSRVLAAFVPEAEAASVAAGGLMRRWALATSTLPVESEEIDEERFREIMSPMRSQAAPSDVFVDEPGVLGMLRSSRAETEEGKRAGGPSFATALVFMRIHSRLLSLHLYGVQPSASDADAMKAVALGWKNAIRAVN